MCMTFQLCNYQYHRHIDRVIRPFLSRTSKGRVCHLYMEMSTYETFSILFRCANDYDNKNNNNNDNYDNDDDDDNNDNNNNNNNNS